MKILGIVGSPRKGGNTEALTKIALEEIAKEGIEAELISLSGKKIAPLRRMLLMPINWRMPH
jgi:multimeric flavodoxin WrbA